MLTFRSAGIDVPAVSLAVVDNRVRVVVVGHSFQKRALSSLSAHKTWELSHEMLTLGATT